MDIPLEEAHHTTSESGNLVGPDVRRDWRAAYDAMREPCHGPKTRVANRVRLGSWPRIWHPRSRGLPTVPPPRLRRPSPVGSAGPEGSELS